MKLTRRALSAAVVAVSLVTMACGSEGTTAPVAPNPIVGVAVTAKSISSVSV